MDRIVGYKVLGSVFFIILFVLTAVLISSHKKILDREQAAAATYQAALSDKKNELISQLLTALPIKAQHILVYDYSKNEAIWERDAQTTSNLASLTKIVTADVIRQLPEQEICITAEDLEALGDQNLAPGTCFLRDAALSAMLVSSSNDLARAFDRIHENKLVEATNLYTEELGLSFNVQDSSGWDFQNPDRASTGNAYDVADVMFRFVVNTPAVALTTAEPTLSLGEFEFEHTYPNVESVKNLGFLKTGYTDLAGGNMAGILEPAPGVFIGVVLMESSFQERFSDFELITHTINSVYQFFEVL